MTWGTLMSRAGGMCEFCGGTEDLLPCDVPGAGEILLCEICQGEPPAAHWRCLETAAWSGEPEVQVAVWRKLGGIDEAWAAQLRDQMILSPEAEAVIAAPAALEHRDSNGALLAAGDTVVLIKDLPVKGAGFTAKRGTAVRGISLVPDNAAQIEGRVEGQKIVILTEFVKRK